MTSFTISGAELPSDVAGLNQVVQGLLIHDAWLRCYDADIATFGTFSRATLPIMERLALVMRDGRNLTYRRPVEQREIGTCRDFALMMCAFLRATGTAARLRCGFASYLGDDWEDHWVCEYWDSHAAGLRLADAQLDDVISAACGIAFDPADVPREAFLTAPEAWLRCRAGNDDPDRYRHGDTHGTWFIGVNLVRDAFAVNNHEISDWDRWREAEPTQRILSLQELAMLDELACSPEAKSGKRTPPWLVLTS